jgi:hypothetical protein
MRMMDAIAATRSASSPMKPGGVRAGTRAVLALAAVAAGLWLAASVGIPMPRARSVVQAADKKCGPPSYCARTDRKAEPYAATPPAIGLAGSIVTDPAFGSRIVRVTDAETNPQRRGSPFFTPSSSENNAWNTNSTRVLIADNAGAMWLFDFDPNTFHPHGARKLNLPWRTAQFSYIQPDILYGVAGRDPVFQQYDAASDKLNTIADGSHCVSLKAGDFGTLFGISADDNRLLAVFGPQQDTNYLVYVYDRQKGCRWYNTRTGEIGGKWGSLGTIAAPYRFTIHDARISKSGQFVEISGGGKGPIYWDVETTNVVLCADKEDQCLGHHAMGYSHMINSPNRKHPLELVVRPLSDLTAFKPIMGPLPPLVGWYDYHISWNDADSQDDNPACFSTYRPGNPSTPGAPLMVSGPWENEIDCVEMDRKDSTVWRFAHTYSTAKNGFWSQPRGNVSQDGRFFVFTSDWQDQLGLGPGGKSYRTDVFIVELR